MRNRADLVAGASNAVMTWTLMMVEYLGDDENSSRKLNLILFMVVPTATLILAMFTLCFGYYYYYYYKSNLLLDSFTCLPGTTREFQFKRPSNNFHQKIMLGQGGFGVVYTDGRDGALNGMALLRGEITEQGLHSPTFHDVGMSPWNNNQLQQRQQSDVPSSSFQKTDFSDSSTKYVTSVAPTVQNMLGSLGAEGVDNNVFNFSRTGHSVLSEPSQQPWVSKFSQSQVILPATSLSLPAYKPGQESFSLDTQNNALFGSNIDSGLLLPTTISSVGTSSVNVDSSSKPMGTQVFQGSMYGCISDSSKLLHTSAQVDPSTPSPTFVKVYKSGSVGRSLDITRFNSYPELRKELGQMFGIEGLLEDPHRSGWHLVFVDRECDVLLLGDDPWEVFVNNVWYIKMLSPEDVLKLGKQEVESLGHGVDARVNPSRNDARALTSGLSSLGSLEYQVR